MVHGAYRRAALVCGLLAATLLAGCKQEAAVAPLTRVRVVTTEITEFAPRITLTGAIAAQGQSEVSFRIAGKISERLVDVGDHVKADQVIARLDPEQQQADLQSAQAGVQSAQATLTQATANLARLKDPPPRSIAARRERDQAEASRRAAQAQLDEARAQLTAATDQVHLTELRAGADGIIASRLAEAGQVVSQAQPVYALVRDDRRDAVFDVHEWALANVEFDKGLAVSLAGDPAVTANGTVRLVSPAVDPATLTVQIRFGLADPPPAMALGSPVNGIGPLKPHSAVLLPWQAVFARDGKPAVWVVDASAGTVSLQPVTIDRYTSESIAVTGLDSGLTIVSAGAQMLRPGQKVETVAERKS